MSTNTETPAMYEGRRVFVSSRRWVAGGAVVDVRRDPLESDWPWTVSHFTCPAEQVTQRPER